MARRIPTTGCPVPLLLLALLWTVPSRGLAQQPEKDQKSSAPVPAEEAAPDPDPDGSEDLDQVLKAHVQRGEALYKSGQYDQAIDEFKAARELDAQPVFLFQAARCYQRSGRSKEALAIYKQFLKEEPGSPHKGEAQGAIKELQDKLDREDRPVWKKAWFWGVIGGAVVVVGVGIGLGVAFGRSQPPVPAM